MHRYYQNRLGRFSSPDPLAGHLPNPQSLNRYAYVQNDPVDSVDPLGLYCIPGHCPGDPEPDGPEVNLIDASMSSDNFFDRTAGLGGIFRNWFFYSGVRGSLTKTFRKKLEEALKNLADRCKKVLPTSELSNGVSALEFYDARTTSSPDANIRGSDVYPKASSKTLFELANHTGGLVLRGGDGSFSNDVVIGSLWNGLGDWQSATLVHESMHAVLKQDDDQLWEFAKSKGAVPDAKSNKASWNLSRWLMAGCPDER
jgi:hypothetical protein